MPEPDRVAMIRYTIVDEAETCATFAEPARATLADLNDRAHKASSGHDLTACADLLARIRDRVAALDPARLEPRRGLAGLFDSRTKRLKAFRAAYADAAEAVFRATADIGERGSGLARTGDLLDGLWTQTRDAIADLDAHLAAARSWLAGREAIEPPTTPMSSEPDVEAAHAITLDPASIPAQEGPRSQTEAIADPTEVPPPVPEPPYTATPVAFLPHPLETRIASLIALRAEAIARLPLIRAVQNADWRAPAALASARDAVETWQADWQGALGLTGKKHKKIRPDPAVLTQAQTRLLGHLSAVETEIQAAGDRRAELEARYAPAWARLAA